MFPVFRLKLLRPLSLLAFAVLLMALALSCGEGSNGPSVVIILATPGSSEQALSTPTPTPAPSASPSPSPKLTPLQVCASNPDPASPGELQLDSPSADQKVSLPVEVRGWGANIGKAESGVAIAIVNEKQEILQVLNVPPQPRAYRVPPQGLAISDFTRPFAADILLSGLSGPTPFCLWVYLETNGEGVPQQVIQIPFLAAP